MSILFVQYPLKLYIEGNSSRIIFSIDSIQSLILSFWSFSDHSADLPVTTTKEYDFGPFQVSIRCDEVLTPIEAFELLDGIDHTGQKVWEASHYLPLFLLPFQAENEEGKDEVSEDLRLANHRIVELGCGSGLLACALGRYSPSYTFTDKDAMVLGVAEGNVRANLDEYLATQCQSHLLDFTDSDAVSELGSELGGCSMVVAADIIYDEEVVEPIFQAVSALLSSSSSSSSSKYFVLGYTPYCFKKFDVLMEPMLDKYGFDLVLPSSYQKEEEEEEEEEEEGKKKAFVTSHLPVVPVEAFLERSHALMKNLDEVGALVALFRKRE